MFLLYNFLLTLLAPLWVPWMLVRTARRKQPVNWAERQGAFDIPPRGKDRRIWFHAVSVGEVMAALPILRALKIELPKHQIVLTVTTSSGHQTAIEKAIGLYDHLLYFPIDIPRFQLRAMQRVQPDVIAIMETELWMNFLWAAKTFDARTLLINGRISDRNFRRSKHLAFFYRHLLRDVDRCLMQSATDAERVRALGAKEIEVFGNCKFDQAVEALDADPVHWRTELGLEATRPVIVVGSIRAEEFKFIAQAVAGVSEAQWIIAPRHLETTPALVDDLTAQGLNVARRSLEQTGGSLILDTYGELAAVYSVADVVVIGGGFANLGGQNILQPLALGKPILFGPHMQNFRDVAAMAVSSGAADVCASAEQLIAALKHIIAEPDERAERGERARALVQANLGASARYAAAIAAEVKSA